MDTWVCMAESLCCPLGSITTLLIGYRPNTGASLVAQWVKNLPAVQETWAQSLRLEDLLEKEMTTHYSILAWKIP